MANNVIYAEVDWAAKWEHQGVLETSSLRKNPRMNSTTTMHLAGNKGKVTNDGRPTAGQQTHFMGPGERVVGGQLRYIYTDQQRGLTTPIRTADPAEILREYKATMTADKMSKQASGITIPASIIAGGDGNGQRPAASATSPSSNTLTYWDGKQKYHIPAPTSPTSRQTAPAGFGQSAAFTYTTHQTMARGGASQHPGSTLYSTSGTTFGRTAGSVSVAAQAQQSLADSVRTYGLVYKPIGHKDYEDMNKKFDGLYCWEKHGGSLVASVDINKPSRLMGPWEHTSTKLSLRYGNTGRT